MAEFNDWYQKYIAKTPMLNSIMSLRKQML